jgi:hypothetical protein
MCAFNANQKGVDMSIELSVMPCGTGKPLREAIAEVRRLGARGALAEVLAMATGAYRRRLVGATYQIAMPIVFARLTRRLELRKGHRRCATSVSHLADDCLDRFEDDMEAVVDDVARGAREPIRDLDAWIASRLNKATVDGHRRRRGMLGAQQRPRLPRWLASALGEDPWLKELAVNILVWAGTSTTAGFDVWPTDSWEAARIQYRSTGGTGGIQTDIDTVLAAMRTRPDWFASYVEHPLGRKRAPVAYLAEHEGGRPAEQSALSLVEPETQDDALLRAMAYVAIEAIRVRTRAGEPVRPVVAAVIGKLFGSHDAGPHIPALFDDPARLDRIVEEVLALVEQPGDCPIG